MDSQFQFPRYTSLAFPPYRFLPGVDPHPVANPLGHSYRMPGEAEPAVVFVPAGRWRESEAYLFGCDLYNHGYWWEAHEAWEGLWRVVPKPSVQRSFLQGLIQVSAGHLQIRIDKAEGLRRLRASSRRHLDVVFTEAGAGEYMGLALAAWYAAVDAYWDVALSASRLVHDAATYPYLRLAVESTR